MRGDLSSSKVNKTKETYFYSHFSGVTRTKEHSKTVPEPLKKQPKVYPFLGHKYRLTTTPVEEQDTHMKNRQLYIQRAMKGQENLQHALTRHKEEIKIYHGLSKQELAHQRNAALEVILQGRLVNVEQVTSWKGQQSLEKNSNTHDALIKPGEAHEEVTKTKEGKALTLHPQGNEDLIGKPKDKQEAITTQRQHKDTKKKVQYAIMTCKDTNRTYRVAVDDAQLLDSSTTTSSENDTNSSWAMSSSHNGTSDSDMEVMEDDELDTLVHATPEAKINADNHMMEMFLMRDHGRDALQCLPAFVPHEHVQVINTKNIEESNAATKRLSRRRGYVSTAEKKWSPPNRSMCYFLPVDAQGRWDAKRVYPLEAAFNDGKKGGYTTLSASAQTNRLKKNSTMADVKSRKLTKEQCTKVITSHAYYSFTLCPNHDKTDRKKLLKQVRVKWQDEKGRFDKETYMVTYGPLNKCCAQFNVNSSEVIAEKRPKRRLNLSPELHDAIWETYLDRRSIKGTVEKFTSQKPGEKITRAGNAVTVNKVRAVVKEERKKLGKVLAGNDADHCKRLITRLVQNDDDFIRQIAFGNGSGPHRSSMTVTVADKEVLACAARLIGSGGADLLLDTTYNIGKRYLTVTSFSHPYLVSRKHNTRVTIFLSAYLHTDQTEDAFVSYLSTLKKDLESAAMKKNIKDRKPLFSRFIMNSPTAEMSDDEVTTFTAHADKDKALNNALRRVFGESVTILNCQRHTRQNLIRKMRELKVDPEVARQYDQDIFHRGSAAVNAKDTAEAMERMDSAAVTAANHMEELQAEAFIEYTDDHVKKTVMEIVQYKNKRCEDMPGYQPMTTTNAAESLHHALKRKINWRQLEPQELIEYLREVSYSQYADMLKAIYDCGEYKLTQEAKSGLKKATKKKYPLTRGEYANLTQKQQEKAIAALNTFDTTLFINDKGDKESLPYEVDLDKTLATKKVPLGKKKNQTQGQVSHRTRTPKKPNKTRRILGFQSSDESD
jgi:hypothetical protein